MSEITLEKVDLVRERTGVSYSEAKEALEASDGNVVDALIYLEKNKQSTFNDIYTTKDEFLNWIKGVIEKGNVTRIVIKKDEKVLANIPINAGIAVTGLFVLVLPELLAIGILTAVITKVTIEITKEDGSVEVVNKVIKNTVDGMKDKFSDISGEVKEKVTNITNDVKDKFSNKSNSNDEDNVYKYTVKFEEIDEEK